MPKNPGLPKKYAKMGFKKGWAAYRKAHPKKKPTKKKSTAKKKKTGSKKKKSNPKKKGSGNVTKKKMTQGDIFMLDAIAGPAARDVAIGLMEDRVEDIPGALSRKYGGFDVDSGEFDFGGLVGGWVGTVHEVAIRKFSRATGVQAYPSKKSPVEMGIFYGKDIINAFANQGDMRAFYEQHYLDYHGVDLTSKGFDAWQPFEMMDARAPLWAYKQLKKGLREQGVKIPKFM